MLPMLWPCLGSDNVLAKALDEATADGFGLVEGCSIGKYARCEGAVAD